MIKRIVFLAMVVFVTQFLGLERAQAQLAACDLAGYQTILAVTPGDMTVRNAVAGLICNNVPQLLATHTASIEAQQAAANQAAGMIAAAGNLAADGAVGAVVGAGGSSGGGVAPAGARSTAYLSSKDMSLRHSTGVNAITSTHNGLGEPLEAQSTSPLERTVWGRGVGVMLPSIHRWAHTGPDSLVIFRRY